jgi:hypothetical protein
MLVTPGTRKSHVGMGRPSFSRKGSRKPPTQASTWKGSLCFCASLPMASMGSITPCGYCGALAASIMVLRSMALAMAFMSTRKSPVTGTYFGFTPK